MSDVILLSSDEETEPSRKRKKLNKECIILSDNDTSDIEIENLKIPKPKMEINSKERVEIIPSKNQVTYGKTKVQNCDNNLIIELKQTGTNNRLLTDSKFQSNKIKPLKIENSMESNASLANKQLLELKNNNCIKGTSLKCRIESPQVQINLESAERIDKEPKKLNHIGNKTSINRITPVSVNQNEQTIEIQDDYETPKSSEDLASQEIEKDQDDIVESLQALINETVALTSKVETKSTSSIENQENVSNNSKTEEVTIESRSNGIYEKFCIFLEKCLDSTKDDTVIHDKLDKKFPLIRKLTNKVINNNDYVKKFENIIDYHMNKLEKFPEHAILQFYEVYKWVKNSYKEIDEQSLLTGKQKYFIFKLEKTLYKIQKCIKKLDETEVNFDDEGNSHYLQTCKYKERAVQIHKKICEIKKQNPNSGNLCYLKLDFSTSKYSAINQALNKKYKNIMGFPTFYDVNKCIRKCVKTNNLRIPEVDLKEEIRIRFKELGELIQKKRQLDLLSYHNDYVESNVDPASHDSELDKKLRDHYKEACQKRKEIIEKYQELQNLGVSPKPSSDSDDSLVANSNSDNDETV